MGFPGVAQSFLSLQSTQSKMQARPTQVIPGISSTACSVGSPGCAYKMDHRTGAVPRQQFFVDQIHPRNPGNLCVKSE
jgi:hypothetical protein